MSEQIITGEHDGNSYEYPPKCFLDICGSTGPDAMTFRKGFWECDECGKRFICWKRDEPNQEARS